jgi:hypothetical protein
VAAVAALAAQERNLQPANPGSRLGKEDASARSAAFLTSIADVIFR